MKLIQITHEDIPCPHCQNMTDKGDSEFGADFPIVEYDDLFYIRKEKSTNRFDLVFEGKVNNSCRIYFCPICGRELV